MTLPAKKMVAADMWSIFHLGDPNARYKAFLEGRRSAVKRFVESLVVHDQVFIPTDDFMSLAIVLSIFGEQRVLTLLEQEVLGFVRVKGALAYVGGGAGLRSYKVRSKEGPEKPFCAPMDEAIGWALGGLQNIKSPSAVTKAAMNATVEIAADVVYLDIRKETINDVTSSAALRQSFGLRAETIDTLPGIAPNKVQIFGGETPEEATDQISALLRIAHANLELRAAEEVGADDLSTACPIGHVLKAKEARLGRKGSQESWVNFSQIVDLPDIAEAIVQDSTKLEKLLQLRQTRHGTEFRTWFHEHCRSDPIRTGKEYAKLLRQEGLAEGPAARVMRFIVTNALGFKFGDVTGTIAGAADSFVVDRLLRRPSAKIFIERLEQLKPLQVGN